MTEQERFQIEQVLAIVRNKVRKDYNDCNYELYVKLEKHLEKVLGYICEHCVEPCSNEECFAKERK